MSIIEPIITRNAARCRSCGDVVESKHRHDFVWCSCKKIAVDGGTAYLKRCGEVDDCEDLSETVEPSIEQVQARLKSRVDHAIEWRDRLKIQPSDWERNYIDEAVTWLRARGVEANGLDSSTAP